MQQDGNIQAEAPREVMQPRIRAARAKGQELPLVEAWKKEEG